MLSFLRHLHATGDPRDVCSGDVIQHPLPYLDKLRELASVHLGLVAAV
jgi:hypothetical protein